MEAFKILLSAIFVLVAWVLIAMAAFQINHQLGLFVVGIMFYLEAIVLAKSK